MRTLVRQEAALLVSVLLIVGALWTFIEIVDEIEGGEVDEVDRWVIDLLRDETRPEAPIGPDWLITAALDVTAVGSTAVLALMVGLVAGYLAMLRDYRSMWLVVIASVLGQVLSSTLKLAFGRDRPDEALHLAEVSTASFPSGHATVGAVVYLTLAAVLVATRTRWRERAYIIGAALLITGLVGVSRVYIGVHYTTDVLAGWCVGLCWALLCLILARWIQRPPRRREGIEG